MLALRSSNQAVPRVRSEFNELLSARHGRPFSDEHMQRILNQLSAWGIAKIIDDRYAGETLALYTAKVPSSFEQVASLGHADVIEKGSSGGADWFNRVFENDAFWSDLGDEPIPKVGDLDGSNATTDIPAADRIVTLTHNQFNEIDEPTGELLEALERDNGVPDNPGLKERLIGQISAGRELLRAGEFQLAIFQATMLDGLRELQARYGDHVIGAAASALLTLILHVLGLPGF